MNDQSVQSRGRQVIRMVWMITLAGFSVGLVMLGIFYWTLSKIHAEREQLSDFQMGLTRVLTAIDTQVTAGYEDFNLLLNADATAPASAAWLAGLASLMDRCRRLSSEPDFLEALDEVRSILERAGQEREACLTWKSSMLLIQAKLPDVRGAVDLTLRQMRYAVIRLEGGQRLKTAVAIRDYRQSPNSQAVQLGRRIIADMSQGSQIIAIKTEISDLELLCERLTAEVQVDNLSDLKDNRFKPTLDRLARGFDLLSSSSADGGTQAVSLLDQFKNHLLGAGFRVDNVHQTIVPGQDGLYPLCAQRLASLKDQIALRKRIENIFNDFRDARQSLVLRADALAGQTAQHAETALAKAWKTMLLVWLVSISVFLMLAIGIARGAKRQIMTIETINLSLRNEIQERLRVETALRQSRQDLRSSRAELEYRVEARTAELKEANLKLGGEVAMRQRTESQLRQRGQELVAALAAARKARQAAEVQRDKFQRALALAIQSKRRLEILISDATAREEFMVDLKREINTLRGQLGKAPKYEAPVKVRRFLRGESSISSN